MKKLFVLLLCAFTLSAIVPDASAALFHRSRARTVRPVKTKRVQKTRKVQKVRKARRVHRKAGRVKPSQQALN